MLLNISMRRYKAYTPGGLYFNLSWVDGVCCIIVYDILDCEVQIRYFVDSTSALRYINNL